MSHISNFSLKVMFFCFFSQLDFFHRSQVRSQKNWIQLLIRFRFNWYFMWLVQVLYTGVDNIYIYIYTLYIYTIDILYIYYIYIHNIYINRLFDAFSFLSGRFLLNIFEIWNLFRWWKSTTLFSTVDTFFTKILKT